MVVRNDSTVKIAAPKRLGQRRGIVAGIVILERADPVAQEQKRRHRDHADRPQPQFGIAQVAPTSDRRTVAGKQPAASAKTRKHEDQRPRPAMPDAGPDSPPTGEMPLVASVDIAWQSATSGASPAISSPIHSTSVSPA